MAAITSAQTWEITRYMGGDKGLIRFWVIAREHTTSIISSILFRCEFNIDN
jgi:hypothetical protein